MRLSEGRIVAFKKVVLPAPSPTGWVRQQLQENKDWCLGNEVQPIAELHATAT